MNHPVSRNHDRDDGGEDDFFARLEADVSADFPGDSRADVVDLNKARSARQQSADPVPDSPPVWGGIVGGGADSDRSAAGFPARVPDPRDGEPADSFSADPEKMTDPDGTWIAQKRAYLEAAPPVIHPVFKRAEDLRHALSWTGRYYGHLTAFHTVRVPLYLGRLSVRAPRGGGRLLLKWGRWVSDADSRPVAQKVIASEDVGTWIQYERQHTRLVRPRRWLSAAVGVAAAACGSAVFLAAPEWATHLLEGGIAPALGLAGGQPDQRIVSHFVTKDDMLRQLTSTEVFDALAAIGIEGRKGRAGVEFAAEVQRDGPGWRAEVNLPPGVTADKVCEKREQLAAAMRRPIATVWPSKDHNAHPGRLVLWVAQQDPAKAPRKLWPLMKSGTADVFKPLPYGFDPRGRRVDIPLMYSNLVVGGIPGSGKTSCALAIALGVALDPTAELWIYELKGSGDLSALKPVCHRYVSGDDDEDIEATLGGLKVAIAEQQRRAKFIRSLPARETPEGRRVTRELAEKYPEQDLWPRVVIVDEAQELFSHSEHGQTAADLAEKAIKKCRAYGIMLIFLTQNPDAGSLPTKVSSSAGTRLCLQVMDWRANNNVLGTSAYERGLRATDISDKEQGTGILTSGRDGVTVRAAFIKQDEAEAIAKRALALRHAAGTVSGEAAGETVATGPAETIVDHTRQVWPDGADAVHSHRLVEALATHRPELYGAWMDEPDPGARSAALSAALRPHGVHTRQITIRDCCGGAKGVRWDDLQGARTAAE